MIKHISYKQLANLAVIALCIMLAITGCKSKKVVTGTNTGKESIAQKSVDQLTATEPKFESARADNAKVNINYSGRKVSANAEININFDNAIKVAVKVFGIDMVIAEITPEHIVLVDKLNKRYCETTFAELQTITGIPVTFSDVQALLTNRLFAIGTPTDKLKKLNPQSSVENNLQTIIFTSGKLKHKFAFNTQDNRIAQTELTTASGNSAAKVSYANFKTIDNILFPTEITINISNTKTKADAAFTLSQLKFNKGAFTTAVDTRKLTKVELRDIIPGL